MRSEPQSAARSRLAIITVAAVVAHLAGCTNARIWDYAGQVESRFLGEPAARALNELGPPRQEGRIDDLRSYVWETGQPGALGGTCRLLLVADPGGVIVDYSLTGTPLGCRRLLKVS